ncbi:MAG: glucosaminidase domain-containing protein [Acidobacteria bacterium]|nr:glucosaminidase domain-containing protein [Acidobacteriota bacterium]
MTNNRSQRLAEVAKIAVRLEGETGIPARMLIAQWAIESRWGAKPVGHFNFFGIKRAKRHTKCCTVETREVINGKDVTRVCEFADYESLEESCRDYAWLITHGPPYLAAWQKYQQEGDPGDLVMSVARVYATDPNYARLASQIAGQTNVAAAIEAARATRA